MINALSHNSAVKKYLLSVADYHYGIQVVCTVLSLLSAILFLIHLHSFHLFHVQLLLFL